MKIKLLLALALGAILVTLTTTGFLVKGYLTEDLDDTGTQRSTGERVLDDLAAVVGLPIDAEEAGALLRQPAETPALRGRVELFGACAGEQDVVVYALERATQLEEFLQRQADPQEEPILATSEVDVTGGFQLELPAGIERVHLLAVGSHGYQLESTPVLLVPPPGRVTLAMYCGGRIDGRAASQSEQASAGALAGIDVRLTTLRRDQGIRSRRLMRVTKTAEDGSYSFPALPLPNDFQVEVALVEFAPDRDDARGLVAGETRQLTYDTRMGAGLRGRVVDPQGSPIAGAEVSAGVEGDMERSGYGKRTALTDTEGRFDLRALPRERVAVRASKPTFLESELQHIELGESESATLPDLVLEPGAVLAGRAQWPDGSPVVGGTVEVSFDRARQFSRFGSLDASRGAKGEATTDERGAFRVSGLGKGPFSLEVQATREERPGDEARAPLWRARLDGVSPGSEELLLVLAPPLAVSGSVHAASGTPLREFSVRSVLMMETAMGRLAREEHDSDYSAAETGPGGEFEVVQLVPGTWTFYASAEGFAPSGGVTLELPTTPAPLLEFQLQPAARISGIVRSPLGAPIAGARVAVDFEGPDWQPDSSGAPSLPYALTADDGSFALEGLAPGSLRLVASADGYCPSRSVPFELTAGETLDSVQLSLREGAQVTGEVLGREDRPIPGALVQLVSTPDFAVRLTRSDEFGEFELQHLEPGTWQVIAMPDRERLQTLASDEGDTASAVFAEMQVTVVELEEGGARHVRLGGVPKDPLRLSGRALLAGRPVPNAILNVFKAGTDVFERSHRTSTDVNGEYSLILDGPGRYTISLVRALPGPMDESHVEFQLDLPRAEELRRDLVLPGGSVRGSLVREDGTPVAHQRVTLAPLCPRPTSSLHGTFYIQSRTDSAGLFRIDGVPAGSYLLGAAGMNSGGLFDRTAEFGRSLRELELGADEELLLEPIVLSPAGAARVLVQDEAGRPVPGAAIFVRSEGGRLLELVAMSLTDSSGVCEYEGLAPGRYRFSARKRDLASVESELIEVGASATSPVKLTLLEGTLLWVQLRDEQNQPLEGAVRLFDAEGRELQSLHTLQELLRGVGDHEFQPNELVLGPFPPGPYRIEATSGDLRDLRPVMLTGRSERKLLLRLR